ncbi:uncharacterized protein LOC128959780 [Oppia nitens]|uniref:uncharacterized protein LOC128959780 n=1 Tax=Oppia nitens TaxID=1686743 RepID=UPI0023D97E12|nr:uncharacterized protein LOC128959780 [Oppia nitens]
MKMFCYDLSVAKYLSAVYLLYSVFGFTRVECHIGQQCSLLRMCLPISSHVYCDESNICRCKKEYPISVGPHSCLAPKQVGERCSHPEECTHNDKNSHCNQSPYTSRCECNPGFNFDRNHRVCVLTETKNTRKGSNPVLMIPTAAGLLMACFSLLCCCALIWHNLCRKQDVLVRNGHNSSNSGRSRRSASNTDSRRGTTAHNRRHQSNDNNQTTGHLPPYESILIDSMNNDPPPSYEDVIKESQTQITGSTHEDSVTETKIT